mmetsp:Transcript_11313/g.17228  ORF Transcript_11313/g.17228 Transcript_11313/m.17228 type:complete len:102 (-) Transcript_11313:245-550(-)
MESHVSLSPKWLKSRLTWKESSSCNDIECMSDPNLDFAHSGLLEARRSLYIHTCRLFNASIDDSMHHHREALRYIAWKSKLTEGVIYLCLTMVSSGDRFGI